MPEQVPAARGDAVESAYAFRVRGPALDVYNALSLSEQECIENALNDLEWLPWPEDARNLGEGHVLAVNRCGYWIIYERDDEERSLDAWALVAG